MEPHDAPGAATDAVALGIETRDDGPASLIILSGELDVAGREPLLARVAALPLEGRDVRLDLCGLAFMDSTGCRAVLEVVAAARERGAGSCAVVAGTSGPVARVLELTGLADAIPVTLIGDA